MIRASVERQIKAMKQMIVDLDRQAGGPGQSWMQIAYSAEEARAIIKANKLAIVLGMEVDSLGNWRRLEDLQEACGNDLDRARELIGAELDWLYDLGIRQITPIHLTDNAFRRHGGLHAPARYPQHFCDRQPLRRGKCL